MANFINNSKTAVRVERRLSLLSLSDALSVSALLMARQLEDESLRHRMIRPGIFNTQPSLSSAIPLFLDASLSSSFPSGSPSLDLIRTVYVCVCVRGG